MKSRSLLIFLFLLSTAAHAAPTPTVEPTAVAEPTVMMQPTEDPNAAPTPEMSPTPVAPAGTEPPTDTTPPELPWYMTTTGIAAATLALVALIKKLLGDQQGGLAAIPVWAYAAATAVVLTTVSHFVFGAFPDGSILKLLWNSGISAATASGLEGWGSNFTKSTSQSIIDKKNE